MNKRVGLYARVSTDEQREQQTIKTQLEYARGRAKLEGWQLVEFVDDGVSGKRIPLASRPAGSRLLEAARRHEVDHVVTYRLDRLGRRARIIHEALEDLTAAGVPYASLTEPFDTSTPAGKLFLGVLAVMAEFEADSITQRTSDGRKRVAGDEARWLAGPVPYGYAQGESYAGGKGHRLVVDPEEANVIRQIFAWAMEGWGSRRIADELNALGIPYGAARPGKRQAKVRRTWDHSVIARILKAETYAGRAAYFRTSRSTDVVHRPVPAIITPATFVAARRAVAANGQFGGAHASREYPLRGLVICGRDGHAMIGRKWASAFAYYCDDCPKGERPILLEHEALDLVWKDVLEFLAEPDATLRAIARGMSEQGDAEDRAERELVAIAAKLRELDEQEAQLLELRLAKTISPPVLERKAKAIQAQRAALQMQMAEVREARAKAARAAEETAAVRRLLGELRRRAERIGQDARKRAEIIRAVTKGIVVYRHGRRTRAHVTYAFGASKPAGVVAASASETASSHRYTPELAREHALEAAGR